MATRYVTKHGSASDSNGGTNATTDAWATAIKGFSSISGGDTLVFGTGTYDVDRSSSQTPIPSGSSGNPTIITDNADGTVTLRHGSTGYGGIFNFNGSAKSYITIQGTSSGSLVLDGNSESATGAGVYLGPSTNHHIELINLEIKNIWNSGVLGGTCEDAVLRACHIHDTGLGRPTEYQDHGFYGYGKNLLIEDCVLHDNIGFGLQIYPGSSGATGVIVRRNRIYANGHGIIVGTVPGISVTTNLIYGNGHTTGDGYGMMLWGCDNAAIYHNSLYNNDGYGIYVNNFGSSTGIRVSNNLVIDNGLGSIRTSNNAASCTVSWNRTDDAGTYGTGTTASNNTTGAVAADIWESPGTSDFNLKAASAAIWDAATNNVPSVGVGTDFVGDPFVHPDQGAYAFGTPDPPDPPVIGHLTNYPVTAWTLENIALTIFDNDGNTKDLTLDGSTDGVSIEFGDTTNCTVT